MIKKIKARLTNFFYEAPKNRDELMSVLKEAQDNELLELQSLRIIEETLQLEKMQVRDVMIPRSNMVILELASSREEILKIIVDSAHSRFPVVGNNHDEVQGILFAKDILHHFVNNKNIDFNCKEYLRPSIIIPESKQLGVLLQEFQQKKNHMAIVMDEYGGISGLITIEDILEQIVGNIDDEHDLEKNNIVDYSEGRFLIKAETSISEFNEFFEVEINSESDKESETIAGLVSQILGYLPKQFDEINILNFKFKVLKANSRKVHLLEVTRKE
jgi:magnesium and cobalt transporter